MQQQMAVRPIPTVAVTVAEVSKVQSYSLCKNLLRASISEVCFLRNLFPSDCFRTITFANTTVRTLDSSSVTDDTCRADLSQVMLWQESAAEALDLGYLRAMVLSIYTAEDNREDRSLIETYVFSFKIPEGGVPSMQLESKGGTSSSTTFSLETVRNSAVSLVRTLVRVAETMKPLPDERILDVHLFYHSHTPEEWQPSSGAFSDSTDEAPVVFSGGAPLRMTLGAVASRHHSLSLKVAYRDDIAVDEERENEEEQQVKEKEIIAEKREKNISVPVTVEKQLTVPLSSVKSTTPAVTFDLPHEVPVEQIVHEQESFIDANIVIHEHESGIDPSVLSLGRTLILKKQKWSVKTFIDAIAIKFDLTSEQARRILKQLVSEGILVNSLNSFTLSDLGSRLAEDNRSSAAAASIEAAAIPANVWIHKAIVFVLGACSKTKTRIMIKSAELRSELGIDKALCDSIISRLKALDIISPTSHLGHEIIWRGEASQKVLDHSLEQLKGFEQARSNSQMHRGRASTTEHNSERVEPVARARGDNLKERKSMMSIPVLPPSSSAVPTTATTSGKKAGRTLSALFDDDEGSTAPLTKRRVF
jgi:hypothetical protein